MDFSLWEFDGTFKKNDGNLCILQQSEMEGGPECSHSISTPCRELISTWKMSPTTKTRVAYELSPGMQVNTENVPLVEFMYLVFTCMPGELP